MLRKVVLLSVFGALLAGPAAAQDATLEEILRNHYQAIGGVDGWRAVNSIKAAGLIQLAPGMEAPFSMQVKRPGMVRIDFTFQGMTGTQAFDGTTAWMVMPFMGKTEPEVMPEELASMIKENADIDGPLVGYKEDGDKIELLGLEDTEGTPAYKLKVTRKDGEVQYYYLDSEAYVPIKIEGSRVLQGVEQQYEVVVSDYKPVAGLMMAHSISEKPKGAPAGQVITLENIQVNTAVADSVFVMPKPKQ